jgi:uncharacterized membrane protein
VPTRHSQFDLYRLLLAAAILGYTLLFTQLAFAQHAGMRTHKADLGQIDQAVWNSSRGRFLEMTDNGFIATRLIDHVEPILVLISPVFWLWDDVRALLLLQVLAVALGAWPLYTIALLRLDTLLTAEERSQIWQVEPLRRMTRPLALTLALAYLLAPQLQSAVLTEFHAVPLVAPLVLWACWAIETRRCWQFAGTTLLVASVKEETALLAAGLGVWAWWRFTIYDLRFTTLSRGVASEPIEAPIRSLRPAAPLRVRHLDFGELSRAVTLTSASSVEPSPCHLVPLAVTLLALAWFYLATFVIVPAHAVTVYGVAESGYFARYGALGDSPLDIVKSFFTRPALVWQIASETPRVDYLRNLLLAFGGFGLLAPEIILLALPVLLANLLSAYPAQYYGEFHYSAPLAPYFAVSAAYGLGRLWRWLGGKARHRAPGFQHLAAASAGAMALAAFVRNSHTTLRPLLAVGLGLWLLAWALLGYSTAGRGPLGARYDPTPINDHHQLLARFLAQVPDAAAVSATAAVHPHVSHRRYVYQFPIGLEPPGAADWALLDVTTNTDMAPGDLKQRIEQLLQAHWGVVDGADGFLLLRRGAPVKAIPAEFYTFAQSDAALTPAPPSPAPRLANVQVLDWPRWRESKVVSQWQAGSTPSASLPDLQIQTPAGEMLYRLNDQPPPALLWHPPQQWAAGETVQLTSLPLYLPRVWGVVTPWPAAEQPPTAWLLNADRTAALAAVYGRTARDQLRALPLDLAQDANWASALATALDETLLETQGAFQIAPQQTLRVRAWRTSRPVPAGERLNLWLQWQGDEWPNGLTVFVHLRRQEHNLAQHDGLPRYFVMYATTEQLQKQGFANDWRQLLLPADAQPDEQLTLVVGLYDPQSGQRAPLIDPAGAVIGNELIAGSITVAAPLVPDQTCALIPATCAAQPWPR